MLPNLSRLAGGERKCFPCNDPYSQPPDWKLPGVSDPDLPENLGKPPEELGNVCAICFEPLAGPAEDNEELPDELERVRSTNRQYHRWCLAKWAWNHDTDPMVPSRRLQPGEIAGLLAFRPRQADEGGDAGMLLDDGLGLLDDGIVILLGDGDDDEDYEEGEEGEEEEGEEEDPFEIIRVRLEVAEFHMDTGLVDAFEERIDDVLLTYRQEMDSLYIQEYGLPDWVTPRLDELMAKALQKDDLVYARKMLVFGPYLDNFIEQVASGNRIRSLKFLFDNGADAVSDGGGRALYRAVVNGYVRIVKLLLDRDALVDDSGGYDTPPLQAAVLANNAEMVKLLLDRGADPNFSGGGASALYRAVVANNAEMVKLLLDRGADPNFSDGGASALYRAVVNGHVRIVKLLLDRDALVDDSGGLPPPPLQAAVWANNAEMVKLLLDRGADPNFDDGAALKGVLERAVTTHDGGDLVSLLVRGGARWPRMDSDFMQQRPAVREWVHRIRAFGMVR
jgi:hypothetical protein